MQPPALLIAVLQDGIRCIQIQDPGANALFLQAADDLLHPRQQLFRADIDGHRGLVMRLR